MFSHSDPYESMEASFDAIFGRSPESKYETLNGAIIVRLTAYETYTLSPACICKMLQYSNTLLHPGIIQSFLKCSFDTARRIQLQLLTNR